MTLLKWFLSLVAGLVLLGAALFYFRPQRPEVLIRAEKKTADLGAVSSVTKVAPVATVASDSDHFREGEPLKRVMDLYESESRRVGQVDQDPVATQKRLELSARELTLQEIRWLEQQATDSKSDMDARFFAVYFLGLSHKLEAIDSLGRIALSPVLESKNQRKVEESRALRASAVEGISQSCKDHPQEAKEKQLEIVALQRDEFLRDRANRGLYACQYGKPIEQQDTEALGKLKRQKR